MAWYRGAMDVIMAVFIFSGALVLFAQLWSVIRARKKSSKDRGKRYLEKEFIIYFLETLNLPEGEKHMTSRG